MYFSTKAGLCLALLVSLAGCGAFKTSKEQYVQRGNDFFEKGQLPEAVLQYRNALNADPAYAEAYYRLGLVSSREGKITDALPMLEKAVDLQPTHEEARLAIAKLYLDGLRYLPTPPQPLYDKLLRIAQHYQKADPKSFHGNRLLGHLAMLDSKPAEAAAYFRAALTAQPDSIEAATLLTQSLLGSGQTKEAESFAQQALTANPAQGALYDILYFQYRRTNRPGEAEELLQKRISANPTDSLAILQLARHYLSLKQPQQAGEAIAKLTAAGSKYPNGLLVTGDFYRDNGDIQRAIEIYKKGAPAAAYQKRLVDIYLRANQLKEATALLDVMLKESPNDNEVIAARASLRAASGQPAEIDAAIAAFTKLVEANPQSASYHYDLAHALLQRNRGDDARKELLKAIEIEPTYLPALEEMARISIQRAQAQEAHKYSLSALSINPRLPRTRLVYSAALALQGQAAEARQEINTLIREYPTLQEAHLQLALLNIQDRRYREAESIYKQYYKPGQKDPRILRGLIALGFASGQPERVLQSLQEEVKLQPASAEVRLLLATTAGRLNKTALALEQFQWLKQNTPPSASTEMALGLAQQQTGNWLGAAAAFQEARKLAPQDPAVLAALAYALQQSGKPAEAVPLYRESLKIKSDADVVKGNLAVALLDSGGDLNEAFQMAQSAAAKEPANALFSDTLGLVYLKRKDTPSATQAFRSAVAKAPESVAYRIHLSNALLESGNKTAAKAELSAAAARKPSATELAEIQALEAKLR